MPSSAAPAVKLAVAEKHMRPPDGELATEVGGGPSRIRFPPEAEIGDSRYRHVVRPGISGWAQVNQGHVAEVDDIHLKLQYDFFYIKYFSPWLDILIVFRTVRTMLTGFGSR